MKNICVTYSETESVYITSFGVESDSKKANWGSGSRNETILHYVLKGEGFYNGKPVKEGEGFLIPPGKIHKYYSSVDNPWEYFWVILNGNNATELCRKYIGEDKYGIFKYDFKDELKRYTLKLFEVKTMSPAKAMGIFLILMSYHEQRTEIHGNSYVLQAQRYMEQNIFRALTIREVAENLHISDRYLYNLFIQHKSLPPKQYLNNLKIERACTMLKNINYSISEIAVSIGFDDVMTFSRFFSKHMKKSPTNYRKNLFLCR